MKRAALNSDLRAWLETATTKKIGLARVPEDITLPYAVLYPTTAGVGIGSWGDPEEDRDFIFQVTSVGEDPRQCTWMSDKVRDAFVSRFGGGFAYTIALSSGNVQNRSVEALGAIMRAGEHLWNVQDIYRVKVGV